PVTAGERAQPVSPDRALPVVVEVRQPVRGLDQRCAAAGCGVGDLGAVGGPAEADLLADRLVLTCRLDVRAAVRWLCGRWSAGPGENLDRGHEPVAEAVRGPDDALAPAVVPDSVA